jgi:hypothetical protein
MRVAHSLPGRRIAKKGGVGEKAAGARGQPGKQVYYIFIPLYMHVDI